MNIYIKLKEKPKNLLDLLEQFFSYQHNSYENILRNVESFFDEDCTELQCEKNKYRTFEDTLCLAQTYFPETTEEELLETLIKCNRSKKLYLYNIACGQVKNSTMCFNYATSDHSDNWSKAYKGPSWKDLFAKIGITSQAALNKKLKETV